MVRSINEAQIVMLPAVFQAATNRMAPASLLLLPSATQKLRTLSAIFWNIATV